MLIWGSWRLPFSFCGGWGGMHSYFCVHPNYIVEVMLCCVFVGVATISSITITWICEYTRVEHKSKLILFLLKICTISHSALLAHFWNSQLFKIQIPSCIKICIKIFLTILHNLVQSSTRKMKHMICMSHLAVLSKLSPSPSWIKLSPPFFHPTITTTRGRDFKTDMYAGSALSGSCC